MKEKKENFTKDWTEPNGVFILHIPTEWQYRNPAIENQKEEHSHIHSFESYKKSGGCLQLSSYSHDEIKVNKNLITQKSNEKLTWRLNRSDDEKFYLYVWYAQTEDRVLIAKYISSKSVKIKNFDIREDLKKVKNALYSLRVIPIKEREWAACLSKNDLFIASLAASYDLLEEALKNKSYIEAVIIISNQIDAYLRSSILIYKQNLEKTDEIELKYIYQEENERGISERTIYKEALNYNIIDQVQYDRLEKLYKERNKVVHRYIISDLKTRAMLDIVIDYHELAQEIWGILEQYEKTQFDKGYGLYGRYPDRNINTGAIKKMHSMINDKHLLDRLERGI